MLKTVSFIQQLFSWRHYQNEWKLPHDENKGGSVLILSYLTCLVWYNYCLSLFDRKSYLSSESWTELKISRVAILWQIMLKYYCFCSENQDKTVKVTFYEAIIQFFCLNCKFQKLLSIFYLCIKWLWKGTGTHIEFQQIERMLVVRQTQGWMLKKKFKHPTLTTCWITFRQRRSVQFSRSGVSDSATPWIAARQASLSITNF